MDDDFFRSIKTLEYVCYRSGEAADADDGGLRRLLRELPGAGVSLVDLDAGEHAARLDRTLLLAGSYETLRLAENTPMAVAGYGMMARPAAAQVGSYQAASGDRAFAGGAGARRPDIIIEGFDEVGVQFLDRVMKRALGVPWVTVVTECCFLREMEPADLDALYEIYAEPHVTDYLEPLRGRDVEERYVRDYIEQFYHFYGYGMWVACARENGRVIGRAGFSHGEYRGETVLEMGYLVAPRFQRRGYATEICLKLIEFARKNLADFGRLYCFTDPGNAAGIALLGRIGFRREGPAGERGADVYSIPLG